MKQIKLILKDDIYDSLERDYHNFVRLSTKIDSGFVKPSFDSYLLAKVSENTNFLTEEAVQHLMLSGQYAWARRAMDKEFPDVVQILIEQAANYGFWIAVRHDWGTEELVNASRAWPAPSSSRPRATKRRSTCWPRRSRRPPPISRWCRNA
jgi:hypothetical protein